MFAPSRQVSTICLDLAVQNGVGVDGSSIDRPRLDESILVGEHDRLYAIAQVKFGEDPAYVRLHRRFG